MSEHLTNSAVDGDEQKESPYNLTRMAVVAAATMVITALVCLIWGWQHAVSALIGGVAILMFGVATHYVVTRTLIVDETKKMKRRIWFGLAWRLLLLALALYAMLRMPWIRLEPLIAGLSIFFPAVIAESIFAFTTLRHSR